MSSYKIAIAGAGIYGCTIAIKLAELGNRVTLYDPLGILKAASSINQFRVHAGYHYPRSPETIKEIIECRNDFVATYKEAMVKDVESFYAIPWDGSFTTPEKFEKIMLSFGLDIDFYKPDWINYDFIEQCYKVIEGIYDPHLLANILTKKIEVLGIRFQHEKLSTDLKNKYDFSIFATYGEGISHLHLFDKIKIQIAEKVQIELPKPLQNKSLVVIDGLFTAFDPYGNTGLSQFGSAKYTNHWTTTNVQNQIPKPYSEILNFSHPAKYDFTNFVKMREEASQVVPQCVNAKYIGSLFTKRIVEDSPKDDRRVLRINKSDERTFHIFSGKVVGALKAAKTISQEIMNA
jgi:hypothetical protein